MKTPAAPLIYVVDDDQAHRDSLTWMIRAAGFRVIAFDSAEQFLAERGPDPGACLVLDVRMHGMTGVELHQELVRRRERMPVIFLTAHGDVAMAVRAIKHGAFDFIEKPFNGKALLVLIRSAVRTGAREVAASAEQRAVEQRLAALTSREHEVMTRVVEGKTNKCIGNELGISVKTVECHRSRMMEKLGAGSIAELVRLVDAVAARAGTNRTVRGTQG
jgi:FixJ family two-component response regulator